MQTRLTSETAMRYVRDYFLRLGEAICVISTAHNYDDADNHTVDVRFVRLNGAEVFTVWQLPDGSIYGEW